MGALNRGFTVFYIVLFDRILTVRSSVTEYSKRNRFSGSSWFSEHTALNIGRINFHLEKQRIIHEVAT